jgi:hypothetical protein
MADGFVNFAVAFKAPREAEELFFAHFPTSPQVSFL